MSDKLPTVGTKIIVTVCTAVKPKEKVLIVSDHQTKSKINPLSVFFIVLLVFVPIAGAQEDRPADGEFDPQRKTPSLITNTVLYPIRFFSEVLSRADGNRCPMYPTCSSYSREAFQKHGLLKGWIMTIDRLLRCGRDELKHSSAIWINGEKRCYDTVSNNDFWW